MKHIAVIGAGGMLGNAVVRWFRNAGDEVVAVTRREFDIARAPVEALADLLGDARHVVNCAGVIKPRIADMPIEEVLRVNAVFPHNLALLCRASDRQLFHVTTDCVYSGARGGYTEEDFFDADDVYGLSKNGGDGAPCMVLRTSIIGEETGQSRSLLEWARSQAGKQVNGFVNHRWNGVTTVHLAEIVGTIIDRGLYREGIHHVHSPDTFTKHELVSLIDEVYELGMTVVPVDAPIACNRDLASVHGLSREVATKPLRQQIAEMRRFFAS